MSKEEVVVNKELAAVADAMSDLMDDLINRPAEDDKDAREITEASKSLLRIERKVAFVRVEFNRLLVHYINRTYMQPMRTDFLQEALQTLQQAQSRVKWNGKQLGRHESVETAQTILNGIVYHQQKGNIKYRGFGKVFAICNVGENGEEENEDEPLYITEKWNERFASIAQKLLVVPHQTLQKSVIALGSLDEKEQLAVFQGVFKTTEERRFFDEWEPFDGSDHLTSCVIQTANHQVLKYHRVLVEDLEDF